MVSAVVIAILGVDAFALEALAAHLALAIAFPHQPRLEALPGPDPTTI